MQLMLSALRPVTMLMLMRFKGLAQRARQGPSSGLNHQGMDSAIPLEQFMLIWKFEVNAGAPMVAFL